MSQMNRRQFVAAAAGACALCLCKGALALAAEPVDAGDVKTFATDGIYDKRASGYLLVRSNGRLYVLTSVCTHKQATIAVDADNRSQIKCPKHGSTFSAEGRVVKGPAKKPLPRLGISLNEQNHVIVDPTRQFEEADWDKPGAFLKVN